MAGPPLAPLPTARANRLESCPGKSSVRRVVRGYRTGWLMVVTSGTGRSVGCDGDADAHAGGHVRFRIEARMGGQQGTDGRGQMTDNRGAEDSRKAGPYDDRREKLVPSRQDGIGFCGLTYGLVPDQRSQCTLVGAEILL